MHLLLLASPPATVPSLLPSLALLPHRVEVLAPEPAALLYSPDCDVVLIDATSDLAHARTTCRMLHATGVAVPLIAVVAEGGMTVLSAQWGIDDFIADSAGPAEIEARLRLAVRPTERGGDGDDASSMIGAGELEIDPNAYTVRVQGEILDLTYKEFELLKYLAQHPGRVFTRAQLLQEVWGYDYYGGTRTVDVHVRRLRAKLGTEFEAVIGTVRGVGYRFDPPRELRESPGDAPLGPDAAPHDRSERRPTPSAAGRAVP